MNEKELRQKVVGNSIASNMLLGLKLIFDIIPQILLVVLIDGLIVGNLSKAELQLIFLGMIGCYIFKGVFYYLATKVAHEKAYGRLAEIRLEIIRHLKGVNSGFFKEHNVGELTNIIQHDVEQVEVYLAHGLPEIMSATMLPILMFVAILFVDYRLAVAMIAGVPLMFLVKLLSAKTMKEKFQIYFNQEMKMREELMEYVKNIAVIKAFAGEEALSEKTLKTARSYVETLKKSMGAVTIPMVLTDIFMETGVVFVMILGSIFLVNGEMTVIGFILAIIFSGVFVSGISKIATLHHFSIVFKEALKNVMKILGASLPSTKESKKLEAGDIEFRNVKFKYKNEGFALENINLKLKKNTLNALIGASGCGKSTLANLLMGFWHVDEGEILINGKNISDFSTESISRLIGSVQQEVILFNLSIFENIAIGRAGASMEEVISAARKARCHEFISGLPKGYDTKVGEMGVKLSGGEKQRIAIARMILKDAPILVLDEAMAAVDSENERLIGEAIEDLRKDRTVITIAHNLNTIRGSGQIVVMDKGRVLSTGTHEELMRSCSFYKEMVEAQNRVDKWNLREEGGESV